MLATHNAGTGYFAGAGGFREHALVDQSTDLVTQLNCGVRAFDFRIGTYVSSGVRTPLLFLHGQDGYAFIQEEFATVRRAMTDVVDWAMEHPSELLVFMLKNCLICGECKPGVPWKGCGCKPTDCLEPSLMAPIKQLGIPIMEDCNYKEWNRAKLMDAARMVPGKNVYWKAKPGWGNGAHILVVPATTGGCVRENFDAGIKRSRADYWECVPWSKCDEDCKEAGGTEEMCSDKEVTYIKTWYYSDCIRAKKKYRLRPRNKYPKWLQRNCGEYKKTNFKRLYGYFNESLNEKKLENGEDSPFMERERNKTPYWLQAFWQQQSKKAAQVRYGAGLITNMIEATTESKINYRVLEYLKQEGIVDKVSIVLVNEVCHAGPEIAELLGTTVSDADRAECKASCEAKKLGNRPPGDACSKDWQCQSQMCGFTQAGAHETKCCSEGEHLTMYAGRDYCTPFSDGDACWSDAQCESEYCPGNGNGFQKGTCVTRFSKKPGEPCVANDECKRLQRTNRLSACGRATAAPGAKTQCCEQGKTTYAGFDYCKKMPDGAECWSNDMCESEYCKGNLGGLQRGKCFTTLANGAKCTSNIECKSKACGRPEAGTDSLICCEHGKTNFWGYDYCKKMPDDKKCKSNAMCNSGYCRSGKCFTKKGDWASCPAQNSYCRKGNCNRTTRYGHYKCCPRGTFWCGPWTSGDCQSSFYYCKGTLGH